MALIDHVYLDAGLTDQFDDATDTLGASALQGADGDGVFYVGTTVATNKIEAASNPGVDQIAVSIADSAPGGGVEVTDIKLATSQANLGSAVGGAPLNIGTTIAGGVPSAVPVWYRWNNTQGSAVYTEISIEIVPRVESAV